MRNSSITTAIAAAALLLLAGCGGDDSTVAGTPAQPSAAATTSAGASTSKGGDSSSQAPITSPGEAATAPPEQPQPAPSGFPGPATAPTDARDKQLIEELDKKGIKSSGNGENAVSIANYVCAAVRDGSPQDQIDTYVTALAGVELGLSGSQLAPEEAATIYKDTARATYCN